MNILVTGGCGFIGSNFIKHVLTDSKHRVINLDAMTYAGRGRNLEHMGLANSDDYLFVQGDITDAKIVNSVLSIGNLDAVVNFAAESHVDRSIEDDAPFARANFEGARVLLNAARKHGIGKFVQVGTDEVYGSLYEDERSSKEEDVLRPSSSYSAIKAGADLLALSYFETHGLPVCVTRSSNNYGPYQFPEKVIPLFTTNLLEGKKIPLYGDGRNIRDWLHVEDHCRAIFKVLENGIPGKIYNIGAGNQKRNIDLARMILGEMGLGEDRIEHVRDRAGHDRRYSVDSTKIRTGLGWKLEIDFVEGIKQTIEWYRQNENWWKKLKDGK